MTRIVDALLLSADRATVLLNLGQLAVCVSGLLARSEQYPSLPKATLPLVAGVPATELFTVRTVLRLEYEDGRLLAWRVSKRTTDYSGQSWPGCTVELVPLWGDLTAGVLAVDLPTAGITTPRVALLSRLPTSALGVAFDPTSGAPRVASGAPQFVVGDVAEVYADRRVEVSLTGATPLDVLEAVAESLGCLWRAELVASGSGYAEEVYEVDLYEPTSPVTVTPAKAGRSAFLGTVEGIPDLALANNGELYTPNALGLSVTDDGAGLYTAVFALTAGGDDQQTVAGARWAPLLQDDADADAEGFHRISSPFWISPVGRDNLVPYDGALDGLYLAGYEDPDGPYLIAESRAPDRVKLPPGVRLVYASYGLQHADGLPLARLTLAPAVAEFGRVERAVTYDDVAPYSNLHTEPTCSRAEDPETPLGPWPTAFERDPDAVPPVVFAWTDLDVDVSVGERSAKFTMDAGGVVRTRLVGGAGGGLGLRAAWCSLRVVSGAVTFRMVASDGEVLMAGDVVAGLTLSKVDVQVGEAEVHGRGIRIEWVAQSAGAVLVIDALTITASPNPQPYQPLMGPNALWRRAWEDLLLQQDRTVTASSEFFNLADLGLAPGDVEVGSWVAVHAGGRSPFFAQVLDVSWSESIFGDGQDPERSARFGPAPFTLADRLSGAPEVASKAEGSKRAPEYPVLFDRGALAGPIEGRAVEPGPGASVTASTVERTFLGRTYTLPVLTVGDAAVQTLSVRRIPGRMDAATLLLNDTPLTATPAGFDFTVPENSGYIATF